MFKRAIDLDPSYAAAYAALGLSLVEAALSGWAEFVADDLSRAQTLAQKALSLDPASTAAYRLLALVHMNRRDFDLASSQIERALEINPSDAESHVIRGDILVWAGKAAEALPWLKGALRLDPPNSRAPLFLGMAYYFLGRYGEATEAIDHALAGRLGRNTQPICSGGQLCRVEPAAGGRTRADGGAAHLATSQRGAVRFAIRHGDRP